MDESNRTRAGNIPALERASGLAWADWVAAFERAGAGSLGHTEIARIASETMPDGVDNPDWWAQAAAIAFEQQVGLRVPGQSSSGAYRVGASRTLPMDRDAAIEAWISAYGDVADHLGHGVEGRRTSRTGKRTFWRANLDGAGKIEVAASEKGEGRSTVALQHNDLPDGSRIEEWRAHWKALLAAL